MTIQEATERTALDLARRYERGQGRAVFDVGRSWPDSALVKQADALARAVAPELPRLSCDYLSYTRDGALARLIEVKGRRGSGTSVSLVDRQLACAQALGAHWWLYAAFDCGTPEPYLVVVEEPRRLPWYLLTPPKPVAEGKRRRIGEEGVWHVMPEHILALGERVRV